MTQSRLRDCPVDLCVLLCEQARQLESLIRMAEARARLELVHIVTAQHAQVGVCLLVSHACLRLFNVLAKVAIIMARSAIQFCLLLVIHSMHRVDPTQCKVCSACLQILLAGRTATQPCVNQANIQYSRNCQRG